MTNTVTGMRDGTDQQALLSLLHLFSPSLPVGAFAYSQGLEYALDQGWCQRGEDIQAWIEDNLRFGIGGLDLPIYRRLYRAWQNQDEAGIQYWNEVLLSFRETRELHQEDLQVGGAYARWLSGQHQDIEPKLALCPSPTVVAMNALAAVKTGIPLDHAALGFAWGWVENQVTCASKALPLGQTDSQRILQQLKPLLAEVCTAASHINDENIGSSVFGTAMASAWHEHQYSRLFRS